MINFIKHPIILSISIAVAFFGLYAFSLAMMMESNCLSCHDDVYQKGIKNFYLHSPFVDMECPTCHLGQDSTIIDNRVNTVTTKEITAPIKFFSSSYTKENNFLVEGIIPEATYNINMTFEDRIGHTLEKKYTGIIPASMQDAMANDTEPPVISGINIGPRKKEVFLETTIRWDSDEPSTSCVEYGFSDQYGQRASKDTTLTKHHNVSLYDLTAGKKYHFRVKSRDVSGNEAVSKDYVFNATVSQDLDTTATKNKKKMTEELAISSQLVFLLGSKLGIYVETTTPAKMTVECLTVNKPTAKIKLLASPAASLDAQESVNGQHIYLVTKKELTIKGCYKCHPPEILGVSHPVGVAQKRGTNVPDYLPTLEGGIITCVTCHEVHGGNQKHFTRMKTIKDLCKTCHKEY
jgi:predicted CXXCH cytochrome family protein